MKPIYDSLYRKFQVAAGAAIAQAIIVSSDGSLSLRDWLTIAAAFLGTAGVYGVANKP